MAHAAEGLNQVSQTFLTGFQHAGIALQNAGVNLAYYLAVISLTLTVLIMIIQGEDLNKMVSKLVQSCFLFGIFFGMIYLGGKWIPSFLNGFMFAGSQASELQSLSPNSVFLTGANIAESMVSNALHLGIMHLGSIIVSLFCAITILILYALIAADLVVQLVKAYALVAIGPIIFALGNLELTRPVVINYIKAVIGIGFCLMMIYIIIGIGVHLGQSWTHDFKNASDNPLTYSLQALLPILGGLIVLYIVMKNVPPFIGFLSGATGFRNYGDAAVTGAMTAAAIGAKSIPIAGQAAGMAAQGAVRSGGHLIRGASEGYMAGKTLAGGGSGGGISSGGYFNKLNGLKGVAGGVIGGAIAAPMALSGAASKGVYNSGKAQINRVKGYLSGSGNANSVKK